MRTCVFVVNLPCLRQAQATGRSTTKEKSRFLHKAPLFAMDSGTAKRGAAKALACRLSLSKPERGELNIGFPKKALY